MRASILLAAATLFAGVAAAEPIQLTGTIGNAPVFIDLNRNGDTVSGWYYYLKAGKQIRLDGQLDHNGFFDIEEHSASTNTRTGTFAGRVRDGRWTGTWKNSAGRASRPLVFAESKSTLKDVDGRLRCTARRTDPQFGYRTTHSVDLTLAKGRVKALKLSRRERSDGDRQSCEISLSQMKQVPSPVGVLLRAKADRSDGSNHCTVRIYAAGDYLVIRPGNPSQTGDDCRGAGNTKFCSPNSFWTDLVVNRTKQQCKSVE